MTYIQHCQNQPEKHCCHQLFVDDRFTSLMVSLLEINYELSYSESYSGVLNGHVPLLQENYDKFIVTVGSYAVAVFIVHNGVYKVFDSHSKDLLGQTNPL